MVLTCSSLCWWLGPLHHRYQGQRRSSPHSFLPRAQGLNSSHKSQAAL